MIPLYEYRELRHRAVCLPNIGDYDLSRAQMNPVIYQKFARMVADLCRKDSCVWEPFAPSDGRSFAFFDGTGVQLIAHSLVCNHSQLVQADSTETGPNLFVRFLGSECTNPANRLLDGVIFHPPYFGSVRQSDDPKDLSLEVDEEKYLVNLEASADIAVENLAPGGMVCAIARRYRHGGREIKLDEWMVMMFCGGSLRIQDVWISEPDVVIIMKFEED